jgi:hypothetical protein
MTGNDGLQPKQLLHLAFGGELIDFDTAEFANLNKLDSVGIFPNCAQAYTDQRPVDNARASLNRPTHPPPPWDHGGAANER